MSVVGVQFLIYIRKSIWLFSFVRDIVVVRAVRLDERQS